MSTEALRLLLGEHHLQQTGNRRELISRLEAHTLGQQQQSTNVPATSNVADTVPRNELAALIPSIAEEKMNRPLTQDRQDGGAENARPSLPPNPRLLLTLAQSAPRWQPACRTTASSVLALLSLSRKRGARTGLNAERDRQPGSIPANLYSPPSLYSASNSPDVSDPTHVASLHPDFRQPVPRQPSDEGHIYRHHER